MHGNRNKCIYGCKNVQYVKTGHFLRHVQNKHPEKLEACLKQSETIITKATSPLMNTNSVFVIHCDRCDFKTLKKSALKSHMESHLPYGDREKFECEKCLKTFTRMTSLRVHRLTIHDKIRKYKCPKCIAAFKQLGHLNDHITFKHPGKQSKKFKCELCDRQFLKRFLLTRHWRMAHKVDPGQQPLVVPVKAVGRFKCRCGKEFQVRSRFLKHQLKHEDFNTESQVKFECPEIGCAHAFKQRCNLIRHQKEKGHFKPDELKNLKFVCVCGMKFFTGRGFKFHCEKLKCNNKKKT